MIDFLESYPLPLNLDVEYKKIYARSFEIGQLKHLNTSGAYLSTKNNQTTTEATKDLNLKDKISIVLALGERKRTLQASVVAKDDQGAKLKFHYYNHRDYQIVDDLIYFVEKSKEKRRQRLDFIFNEMF